MKIALNCAAQELGVSSGLAFGNRFAQRNNSMPATSSPLTRDSAGYAFGPYVVDPMRRLVSRDGEVVPLTSKTFELLAVLLECRGRVVSKEELIARLWPNTHVQENNLTRQVCALRKVLRQRPDQHDYIVTIPGQGYRFVAKVKELGVVNDSDRSALLSAPAVLAASGRAWPRSLGFAFLVGGIVLAVAVVKTMGGRPAAAAPERSLRQVTYDSGIAADPTWSPDGRSIAYVSDRESGLDLYALAVGESQPRRLTSGIAEESQPDWSPDGRWLVYRSERDGGGLFVAPSSGGPERRIAPLGYRPSWSRDGNLVLFSSSVHRPGMATAYVVGLDGNAPRAVRPDVTREFRSLVVAWHPTGALSFWGRTRENAWRFLTASMTSGPPTASVIPDAVQEHLASGDIVLDRFLWARSGKYLYFEGRSRGVRNLWRVAVDPQSLAWLSGPDRLTTGPGEDENARLSPDGTRLVFDVRSTRTRLWSYPFDAAAGKVTGAGGPVLASGANEIDGDASPDGALVTYHVARGDRREMWLRSAADGSGRALVGDEDWMRTTPRWSPDGRWLAYTRTPRAANATPPGQVVLLAASGGEEHVLDLSDRSQVVPTDWAADGRSILAACRERGARHFGTCLIALGPDGGGGATGAASLRVLASDTSRSLLCQSFSPNQKWISFVAMDGTDADVTTIYVAPVAGGPWTAITRGDMYDNKPHWSPDGRTLYFMSNRDGAFNVWGQHINPATGAPAGDPFRVTAFSAAQLRLMPNMEIAVRAKRLFLTMTETSSGIWMLEGIDR